jgi:outer membrane receptor protein involved in Fe transport
MFNLAVTHQSTGGSYADFTTDEDVRLGNLNRTLENSLIGQKAVTHLLTYGFEADLLAQVHALGVSHNLLLGADYYRESDYQTCGDINGLRMPVIREECLSGP